MVVKDKTTSLFDGVHCRVHLCFVLRFQFTLRSHSKPTREINLPLPTVSCTPREYYRFLISQRSLSVHVESERFSKMEVNQTEAIIYE